MTIALEIAPLFYTYFTSWSVVLVLLHRVTHRYVNLVFLTLLVSFVGALITYIRPRRIARRFGDVEVEISGWSLRLTDLIFHHLPLFFILYTYAYADRKGGRATTGALPTLIALVIVAFYTRLFDVIAVYNVKTSDLLTTIIAVLAATIAVSQWVKG